MMSEISETPREGLLAACLLALLRDVLTDSCMDPAPGREDEVWEELDTGR